MFNTLKKSAIQSAENIYNSLTFLLTVRNDAEFSVIKSTFLFV